VILKIKLSDFRNFKSKSLELSDKITTIVGKNGIGKTNILEALFLLSTGKSFKARSESEMLRYDTEIARISGVVSSKQQAASKGNLATDYMLHDTNLEIVITTGENGWPKKRLLVNGIPRRTIDFAGNFKTVLFGPWDMDLVTESPSIRRNFLDTVLSQTDREYRRSIMSYEKGIRQRNKLLWKIREEGVPRSQLLFWNQLLIKNGNYITEKREEFIEFVNKTRGLQSTVYQGSDWPSSAYSLQYDKSIISEGRLEQYAREEVASATTLVGPHRDDMQFKIQNSKLKIERDLSAYGSRGEQRMGVLWLKMAELSFIQKVTGERPTLLLDDIFSELDHEHREIVMDVIRGQQTIITTADPHFVAGLKSGGTIRL
jgi:DNA replication and repair protein RecF